MVKSGKPRTKRLKKCLPSHLTLLRSYAIVTYNYTVAMKRRVRRDGIPRELRMVKEALRYLQKMDSEPGRLNHEASRGRPIQREGIKALPAYL